MRGSGSQGGTSKLASASDAMRRVAARGMGPETKRGGPSPRHCFARRSSRAITELRNRPSAAMRSTPTTIIAIPCAVWIDATSE